MFEFKDFDYLTDKEIDLIIDEKVEGNEEKGYVPAYKYKIYKHKSNDKNGEIAIDIAKVEGYRLPTEAEWEYSAKGGNQSKRYIYAGSNKPDDVAWYWDNSKKRTHPVGKKLPNELGLYDMSGNVWEWTTYWNYFSNKSINSCDFFDSFKICGGSWISEANKTAISEEQIKKTITVTII
jgi:formylglycine-generating enzyme required for sulfatase activity